MNIRKFLWGLLFAGCNADLIRKVPEKGVGKILISHDTNHYTYNENRLMVIFDLDCLGDDESTVDVDPSRTSTNQQDKVDSIINNHYQCLSHHNKKNYQLYKTGYGLTFLNVDTEDCLENENVELDYNEHCIHSFVNEPTFDFADFGDDWQQLTTDDYDCTTQDVSGSSLPAGGGWGLDQLDSFNRNLMYKYPNIAFDNGVDLYIVDSGVLASHDEFVNNNVTHMLGDGPSTYVHNDSTTWYQSHGTHVAGTAAGVNYGVSKNLHIYDYRVCQYQEYGIVANKDDAPCYLNLITESLEEISHRIGSSSSPTRRGVINMSIGGSRTFFDFIWEYYFEQINDAGGIVVVAAGNEGDNACDYSPAWSTDVITVGAVNASYWASSFSNWGSCVDVWAPGENITSSVAYCDSCYEVHRGTSMASPHIAGYVANLLWVDPTLKLYEIKSLLMKNTTLVSDFPCDRSYYAPYCQYSFYDGCDTIPSNWYGENNTIAPTTTEAPANETYVGYDGLSGYVNNDCNVLASLELDPQGTDKNNPRNYSIIGISYEPLNLCLSQKDDVNDYLSYGYKCLTDTSAQILYYTQEDCSSIPTTVKTIYHGQIEGDFWYYVDCSKEAYDPTDFIIGDEKNACDLKIRTWYPEDYSTTNEDATTDDTVTNETIINCVYSEDTATYYDSGDILEACYFSTNNTGYSNSWYWTCQSKESVSQHFFFGSKNCSGTPLVQTYDQGCYYPEGNEDGYYLDIISCSSPTTEPSNAPTDLPTYNRAFVFLDSEAFDCDFNDCTQFGRSWATEEVTPPGTDASFAHEITVEQRPIDYIQSSTTVDYSIEYVGYTNSGLSPNRSEWLESNVDNLDGTKQTTTISPTSGTLNVSAYDSDPTDFGEDISGNFGSARLTVTLDDTSSNNYEIFKVTISNCNSDATLGCQIANPEELYMFVKNTVSSNTNFDSGSGGGSNNNGLGTGALVGIIIGGVCLLIVIIVGIGYYCRKQNSRVSYGGGPGPQQSNQNQGLLEKNNKDDKDYKPPAIEIGKTDPDIDEPEDEKDKKVY